MKTRFLLIFGLICAGLFVTVEAGLYFYGMQQVENKVSSNLDTLINYTTDLENSYVSADSIRFRVLCDEIQRKIFAIQGMQSLRIEHQKFGLLYSVKIEESNHQIKEQFKTKNNFRFIAQFEILDAQYTSLLLKTGLIILLLWAGISIIGLLTTEAKIEPHLGAAGESEPVQTNAKLHVDSSPPEAENSVPPTPEPIPVAPAVPVAAIHPESANPPLALQAVLPTTPPAVRTPQSEFLYKLDKEISRCAEFAVELALCVIKIPKLKNAQLVKNRLETEFVHEDLIFMLDSHQFAVILPHHDLDQALARGELFLKSIDRDGIENPEVLQALIGVASRSSRLVDAKRIYQEAVIALRKANSKHGRMVGFRADPTRYRNYLTHQKI